MTAPDWVVSLQSLVGLIAMAAIAFEPDDGTGPDLDYDLTVFTLMPWL